MANDGGTVQDNVGDGVTVRYTANGVTVRREVLETLAMSSSRYESRPFVMCTSLPAINSHTNLNGHHNSNN